MKLYQAVIISLLFVATLPLSVCFGAPSLSFVAGASAGWDFHELAGDIARNNTVDINDLGIIAQQWLASGCGSVNQWCARADIDNSTGVDFVDYALLAKDWTKTGAKGVLLQTIYGVAQDANGTITANTGRALQSFKGMAMAFSVPQNIALDKGIFKWRGIQASNNIRIRLYNVTGKGCLNYLHPMTKADPRQRWGITD